VTDEATGKETPFSFCDSSAGRRTRILPKCVNNPRAASSVPAFAEVLIEISAEGYKLWPSRPSGGREDQPKTRRGANYELPSTRTRR